MQDRKRTGEIIAQILKKTGMSQRTLAKSSGVSQGSISLWVNDENVPKLDTVERILSVIKLDTVGVRRDAFLLQLEDERFLRRVSSARQSHTVQTSTLDSGKSLSRRKVIQFPDAEERPIVLTNTDQFSKVTGIIRIPVPMTVPAGGIMEIPEDLEKLVLEFEYFAADMVWDLHNLFGLTVDGASMVHKKVEDGDTIVVDTEAEPKDGNLVLVRISDTEGLLREIHYKNDLVTLESPTEPAIIVKPSELQLVGKVIRVIKTLE